MSRPWWIQPFIAIQVDSSWSISSHLGFEMNRTRSMFLRQLLFADEVDEAQEKEGCKEVEHPALTAGAPGEELKKSVAGEAEA
jgi:hypothetical protein